MAIPFELSKRNRVLSAINHEDTGRIPYVVFLQPNMSTKLVEYYHTDSIDTVIDNCIEWIGNTLAKQQMEEKGILKNGVYTDEWGILWTDFGETRGQVTSYPLKEPNLQGYQFPDSLSPDVIARMKNIANRNMHRYRCAKLGALWEQATLLRGMEELLIDLYENPQFVHDLLDRIVEVLLATLELFHREISLDCIWLSDDYGTQQNLLMSPSLWREFVKPRVRRVIDAVHEKKYHFALHSDGAIESLLPDFVEMGVDILNPVQPECLDVYHIKREYGKDLTLWGGYGTQRTLTFGTPDEVRREVNEVCDVLGSGGGLILTPGLLIQDNVPVENAAAFIETAIEREKGNSTQSPVITDK